MRDFCEQDVLVKFAIIIWLAVMAAFAAWFFLQSDRTEPKSVVPPTVAATNVPPPPVTPFMHVVTPTARENLDPAIPGTFQPTAAGNLESALFGSVRTVKIGAHLFPSFHEGVDIAPLKRGARGMPLDEIHAVAAGTVGYINHVTGNSNYGKYIVLLHDDPIGRVYTLYAHLSVVAPELREGQTVAAGALLGIMGHTPMDIIPVSRAHLHFEVGVIGNARFAEWFRAQHLKPDHGLCNGLNLFGVNPLEFFRVMGTGTSEGFAPLIKSVPVAFQLMIPATRPLDYFRRYPSLWQGAPLMGPWMVLGSSEDGVILSGREATADEAQKSRARIPVVLSVDEKALGRNGCRLVVNDGGRWRLGEKGAHWLSIIQYGSM